MTQGKLPRRQAEVLNYIKKYTAMHGYPPAIREICSELNLKSPATAFVHVRSLEEKGYLKKTNNKFRSIALLVENEYDEKNEDIIKVPLLGKITAGSPITAIEQPNEFFDLPASLVPRDSEVFTLHVSGESMINRGIYDGDIVIVRRQRNAKNGDIVIAMTDQDEATIKTFYKENGYIRLQPENDTMEPIILDEVTILGKVVGLYRKF